METHEEGRGWVKEARCTGEGENVQDTERHAAKVSDIMNELRGRKWFRAAICLISPKRATCLVLSERLSWRCRELYKSPSAPPFQRAAGWGRCTWGLSDSDATQQRPGWTLGGRVEHTA